MRITQKKSLKNGCHSKVEVLLQYSDVELLDDVVDEVYEILKKAWNIEQEEQIRTTQGGIGDQ